MNKIMFYDPKYPPIYTKSDLINFLTDDKF